MLEEFRGRGVWRAACGVPSAAVEVADDGAQRMRRWKKRERERESSLETGERKVPCSSTFVYSRFCPWILAFPRCSWWRFLLSYKQKKISLEFSRPPLYNNGSLILLLLLLLLLESKTRLKKEKSSSFTS
jgi:hypothetical protein